MLLVYKLSVYVVRVQPLLVVSAPNICKNESHHENQKIVSSTRTNIIVTSLLEYVEVRFYMSNDHMTMKGSHYKLPVFATS